MNANERRGEKLTRLGFLVEALESGDPDSIAEAGPLTGLPNQLQNILQNIPNEAEGKRAEVLQEAHRMAWDHYCDLLLKADREAVKEFYRLWTAVPAFFPELEEQ